MIDNEIEAQNEMNKFINMIKKYWGDNNITDIKINYVTDAPYNMFEFTMKINGKNNVLVEYERSTLGFYISINGEYIGLSKLTEEPIYRGFDSYRTNENILHNFKVLDNVLKAM